MTTDDEFIRTRHEWLDILASKSPTVARLNLKAKVPDALYSAANERAVRNRDAFNFAGSELHNDALARTFDKLAENGTDDRLLVKFLTNLTGGNTYGAFCELSAYGWLLDGHHHFRVQVPVTGADILNPNGSDLDGAVSLPGEVLFDVKAFGFHENLVDQLTARLSDDFYPENVVAEGSWDVSVAVLRDLLGSGYGALREELTKKRFATFGRLRFMVRPHELVQVSHRTVDPYRLAHENADYAFAFAKQFVRHRPFLLLFVLHPWFSASSLLSNFAGFMDTFTRSLARRTFMQFRGDATPMFGMTQGEVSTLLSGVGFINASKLTDSERQDRVQARFFFNPHAKNPISPFSQRFLTMPYRFAASLDNFEHDTY